VVVAYIHGSWARGEPVARDLDVALVVDGDACARAWDVAERVHLRLQATLEAGHPPLDVRPMPLDELVFAARVLRDGIPAFERTHRERIAIETRVLSRWIDFRPSGSRCRSSKPTPTKPPRRPPASSASSAVLRPPDDDVLHRQRVDRAQNRPPPHLARVRTDSNEQV
jgi:predicted nucleotidyltransferase